MPVKVTYFGLKGKAEFIRYILTFAGEEFTDNRINREQWMGGVKAQSPTGGAPMLTLDDGKTYSQSMAVARYCADKNDLRGKTLEEKMFTDMIVETFITDIANALMQAKFDRDEALRPEKLKEATEKTRTWMTKLEALVQGETSFLAGQASWADIILFNCAMDLLPFAQIELNMEEFPKLKKIVDKIGSDSKIQAYIAGRPESTM